MEQQVLGHNDLGRDFSQSITTTSNALYAHSARAQRLLRSNAQSMSAPCCSSSVRTTHRSLCTSLRAPICYPRNTVGNLRSRRTAHLHWPRERSNKFCVPDSVPILIYISWSLTQLRCDQLLYVSRIWQRSGPERP